MFDLIYYFHGFKSDANSKKFLFLESKLKIPIRAIEYPPMADEAYSKILTYFKVNYNNKNQDVLLVGSSLGGFWANYFGVKYNLPVILINPSMQPSNSLSKYINQNIKGEKWKEEYSHNYKKYESLDIEIIPRVFLLSKDDEILDHSNTINKYSKISKIEIFDNAKHHFSQYDQILRSINELNSHSISWGLDGD